MATDFFEHQDAARRQSRRLVVLFVLAVVAIIAAVYGVATALAVGTSRGPEAIPTFDPGRLAIVATAVLVVISGGSLYKVWALSDGGEGVARMLGGRPIHPSTNDPAERRLLNVVEEMALAAGTPVPPVYLLDEEPSINAFAAGLTPGDAVIGVSKGCLDHLTRDEIQGVIGHEFSHILNGDMRLNLRLIGLIHGILVLSLIGQILFRVAAHSRPRSSRDDNKGGGATIFLLVGGVALWLIGLLGVFFGRLIKCAVSRQREFLADSSAVQFTRNPEGLAGALKKIGGLQEGSRLVNPNAEQAAHLFFGQGVPSLGSLLATHPPLEERIRRLDPQFDGAFAREPEGRTVTFPGEEQDALAAGLAPRGPSVASGLAAPSAAENTPFRLSPKAALSSVGTPTEAHVEYATELLQGLPKILNEAARDPFSARAVIYALLIDEDSEIARNQLEHLDEAGARGTAAETLRLIPAVRSLGRAARVPLADLTFPALRQLSPRQYQAFRSNVEALVKADQRVNLFEYALKRMMFRHLDRAFLGRPPSSLRYFSIESVFGDCEVLLSTLASLGHDQAADRDRAYSVGIRRLQDGYPGERVAPILPESRCNLVAVNQALDRLALASPDLKRRVIDASAACIAFDGVVTPAEGELLRAITDSLDCPMPPLPPTAGLA